MEIFICYLLYALIQTALLLKFVLKDVFFKKPIFRVLFFLLAPVFTILIILDVIHNRNYLFHLAKKKLTTATETK